MRSCTRPKPEPAGYAAPPAREEGFSLIEGLMAAALLLVVAVSILPLFMRALDSNTRGGRASQVSTLVTAALEEINQATVDRADFKLTGASSGVRETGTMYWDMGEVYSAGDPAKIGDERWISDPATATGPVLWSRALDVRKYSFADVHVGLEANGIDLAVLGDPNWFDSPLLTDDEGDLYDAHLAEFRVHIVEDRDGGGIPLNSGQRMTVRHFRTF